MEIDVIDLLNSDSDYDRAPDMVRSAGSELLTITNAAVQALDRQPLEDAPKDTTLGHRADEGKVIYADACGLGQDVLIDEIHHEHNSSRSSSASSKTTTASEVLIRSTAGDTPDVVSIHNASITSRGSGSSKASSFLTGQAKPVRVSSKKLKEIKSPFEDVDISTVSRSSSKTSGNFSDQPNLPKTSSKNNSGANTANTSGNSQKSGNNHRGVIVGSDERSKALKDGNSIKNMKHYDKGKPSSTKVKGARSLLNPESDLKENTPRTIADSGYTTHKGCSEQDEKSVKNSSVPVLDGTLEGVITLQEDSIIDVIAKEKQKSPDSESG